MSDGLVGSTRLFKHEVREKEWVDLNFPFYQLIAKISGNDLVPHLLKQFQLQMYRLAWNVNVSPESES